MRRQKPSRDPHMTDMKLRTPTGTGKPCDASVGRGNRIQEMISQPSPKALFRRPRTPFLT